MNEELNALRARLSGLWNPADALINWIDILLVAFILFRLLKLVQGRRAWSILFGIGIFVVVYLVSDRLHLRTLHTLLDKASVLAPVAVVVLFLPELRQALEGLARLGFWNEKLSARFLTGGAPHAKPSFEDVVLAADSLAKSHTGALIVIERERSARLDDVVANGVRVEALATTTLLETIFYGENPLHDGAVVIRGDVILAAGCRLPLSESAKVDRNKHLRHRAGLGISEVTDCIVVIVSEERGRISVAYDGKLIDIEHIQDLRAFLRRELLDEVEAPKP